MAPVYPLLNSARRRDPAKILGLQTRLVREIDKRFRDLKAKIRRKVLEEDFFHIGTNLIPGTLKIHADTRFTFSHDDAQVEQFMDWLRTQEKAGILDITEGLGALPGRFGSTWVDSYYAKAVRESYEKGVKQAQSAMTSAGYKPLIPASSGPVFQLAGPVHSGAIASIYSRTYEDLKTVTDVMNARIRTVMAEGLRVDLARGLAEGKHPFQIAREILKDVDHNLDSIGRTRARLIARTETARAHHLATIEEYRQADAEMKVRVEAEILTAGDDNVCEECEGYADKVMTLDEAESLIPIHPNCRCAVMPVVEKE